MKMFGYIGILIVLVITAFWATTYFKSVSDDSNNINATGIKAAAQAQYVQKKTAGTDFSSGPCLSNELMTGWVLDTVHNPRQAIDDLPQNQCSAYREGNAKHFIELDIDGNFVRMQ